MAKKNKGAKFRRSMGERRQEEWRRKQVLEHLLEDIKRDGNLRERVRQLLLALPEWTPFVDVTADLSSPLARKLGIHDPEVLKKAQELGGTGHPETRAYENSRYFVHITPYEWSAEDELNGWTLSIRTKQNDARHDWREYQRIKNELCGPHCEAVELYPAEDRLMDTANQFFLFVVPEGSKLPFGFTKRTIYDSDPLDREFGVKQRPFEPGQCPPDARTPDPDELSRLLLEAAVLVAKEKRDGNEGSGGGTQEDAERESNRGEMDSSATE